VPLGGRPRLEDVTVPEDEARECARALLYAVHGRASAARLNTMLMRRHVEQAKLDLSPGRLLYVPFDRTPNGYRLPAGDAVVPRLVVDGGPELAALRASVHRRAAELS
jgi:hypothetical protein